MEALTAFEQYLNGTSQPVHETVNPFDEFADKASTKRLEKAYNAVIGALDRQMHTLDDMERLMLATELSSTLTAGALCKYFHDKRHVIGEALAQVTQDTSDKITRINQSIDKGAL